MTNTDNNPAEALAAIIAAGQMAFESTLPAYAQRPDTEEAPDTIINLTLSEERQASNCLNCPLADCIGIEQRECPIQIEQRRVWREQKRRRESQ